MNCDPLYSRSKTEFCPHFSHIYVENEARSYPVTKQILSHFGSSTIVDIDRYMDVFSSTRQEFALQKASRSLILAVKKDGFLYKGAPVCQDFGNDYFYYTSSIMNCLYDCEYCYLQGMYSSANIVVFVNLEDTFAELEQMLSEHPVYLCISYDTDLLPLEELTGFVSRWIDFTNRHENLTVECRTKSAAFSQIEALLHEKKSLRDHKASDIKIAGSNASDIDTSDITYISDRFIFAWTLSPDIVANKYEHLAPSLDARLASVKKALDLCCSVRLCFDPVLHIRDWRTVYSSMIAKVADTLPLSKVKDVSVGSFRISKEYLAGMRRKRPDSELVQYPFITQQGYCGYDEKVAGEMSALLRSELQKHGVTEVFFVKQ